eukprot:615796-Hanusia_phi.AAC.1
MMTPQLFLNYKYKSVEHLPWRALIYRALNTFIDDLFAFVITMPGLHRYAFLLPLAMLFICVLPLFYMPPPSLSPLAGCLSSVTTSSSSSISTSGGST